MIWFSDIYPLFMNSAHTVSCLFWKNIQKAHAITLNSMVKIVNAFDTDPDAGTVCLNCDGCHQDHPGEEDHDPNAAPRREHTMVCGQEGRCLLENCVTSPSSSAPWWECGAKVPPMQAEEWDRLAKETCKGPHNAVVALKRDILKVWEKISPDEIVTACKAVPKSLVQIIKAEGGHIEKK